MKVGITSYPMLWQRTGGLQVQIRHTIHSLRRIGVDAEVIDIYNEKISDFDIVHVFSATHGMYLTLQEARLQGVKTVVSPVFQPDMNLYKYKKFRVASWLLRQITSNEVKSSYDYIGSALHTADRIIALSEKEWAVIEIGYDIKKEKISLVGNGVDPHYFESTADHFVKNSSLDTGFVLIVGSISSFKNQLGVIRATNRNIVLVGQILDHGYFDQCRAEAGERLTYLGTFDFNDPYLGSIYAAAGVTVLASAGEAFGLTVVESLAAGTPAIITEKNGLGLRPQPPYLQFVDSYNSMLLNAAIEKSLGVGFDRREKCRGMVQHMSWDNVAKDLLRIYNETITRGD
ncbi:MAG: glycosyltransferase family 4 protein [Azonexus sp.]|nr:glycosyltransferase family 4 protein [Azonexus sp.]